MSPVRALLAVVVVVVLGAAIAGIGTGHAPKGDPAPTGSALAASKHAIATGDAQVQEGRHEFADEHCATCHAIAATGADGKLGPRMDTQDDPAKVIVGNIVHPRSDIAEGYEAHLMPTDYAKRMTPAQIRAVAAFVKAASAGAKG